MNTIYELPLIERYSSKEMLYIFSPHFKFETWRKLWIYLAESGFLLHRRNFFVEREHSEGGCDG